MTRSRFFYSTPRILRLSSSPPVTLIEQAANLKFIWEIATHPHALVMIMRGAITPGSKEVLKLTAIWELFCTSAPDKTGSKVTRPLYGAKDAQKFSSGRPRRSRLH